MMERSVCACVHTFFLSRLYERHIITAAYTQLHAQHNFDNDGRRIEHEKCLTVYCT